MSYFLGARAQRGPSRRRPNSVWCPAAAGTQVGRSCWRRRGRGGATRGCARAAAGRVASHPGEAMPPAACAAAWSDGSLPSKLK